MRVHPDAQLGFYFDAQPEAKIFMILGNEMIQNRSAEPIKAGSLIRGWLCVPFIKNMSSSHGLRLSFKDVLGQEHSIALDALEAIPPFPDKMMRFFNFPDLTFPLMDKAQADELVKRRQKRDDSFRR